MLIRVKIRRSAEYRANSEEQLDTMKKGIEKPVEKTVEKPGGVDWCKICHKHIPQGQWKSLKQALFKHKWAVHREKMMAHSQKTLAAANAAKQKKKDTTSPSGTAQDTGGEGHKSAERVKTTTVIEEASIFANVPKKMEFTSVLLPLAKHVCEKEWHWPVLSLGDFVDTFLYETMKQRGIILSAYQVVKPPKKTKEENDGG